MEAKLPVRKSAAMEIWFTGKRDEDKTRIYDFFVNGNRLGELLYVEDEFQNLTEDFQLDEFRNIKSGDYVESLSLHFGSPLSFESLAHGLVDSVYVSGLGIEAEVVLWVSPANVGSPYLMWDPEIFLSEMKKRCEGCRIEPAPDYEALTAVTQNVYFTIKSSTEFIGEIVEIAVGEIARLAEETHNHLLLSK